jgi:rRNA processing protein Gar1
MRSERKNKMIDAELLYVVGDLRVARPKAYKDVKRVRLGSLVYVDEQPVGRVIDIIGPIKRPYIVIKPLRPLRVDEVFGIPIKIAR